MIVVCSTTGCENHGIQIEVPNESTVVCGPCGQWIIPPEEEPL